MTAHGNAHVAKQQYYVDYGVAYDINVTARRRQSERDQERDTLIAIGKEEKSKKKKKTAVEFPKRRKDISSGSGP